MKQEQFTKLRQLNWLQVEQFLAPGPQDRISSREFTRLYRLTCADLAKARQRGYDDHLLRRLHNMVLAGHERLYAQRQRTLREVFDYLGKRFPATVRSEWKLVMLCHLLFYGLAGLVAMHITIDPDVTFAYLSPDQVASMESMYDPSSSHHLKPRGYDSDAAMFGYYIMNNISIAFRTFASGLFAGIGSLFMVAYNGVFMGAVFAHLVSVGYHQPLFSFVIGHGSFELTAIIFSGAAGLKLGWGLIAPGPYSRTYSLQRAAKAALPIVWGSFAMLLLAATIEAFWSSTTLPAEVKYSVGGLGWAAHLAFFGFAGKSAS